MAARVVFSDGSKAMAHNLDDLRERWLLKKQAEIQITHEPFDLEAQPTYRDPESLEQAEAWRKIIVERVKKVELLLTKMNGYGKDRAFPFREYSARRESLLAEKDYVHGLAADIKIAVKRYRHNRAVDEDYANQIAVAGLDEFSRNNLQKLQDSWRRLRLANKRIKLLESLLSANNIEFPPDQRQDE